MITLSRMGVNGVGLWRMGSEDPGFWHALGAWRSAGKPDLASIDQDDNVDVEGQGEILRITATPTLGERQVTFDPRDRLISTETYRSLPTPFVVQRTGDLPKKVALTFDDGPDPIWTPQILSILEAYHVPATFFRDRRKRRRQPRPARREVRDGDDIGNHTYTHPNLAQDSPTGVNLELNANQRLVEGLYRPFDPAVPRAVFRRCRADHRRRNRPGAAGAAAWLYGGRAARRSRRLDETGNQDYRRSDAGTGHGRHPRTLGQHHPAPRWRRRPRANRRGAARDHRRPADRRDTPIVPVSHRSPGSAHAQVMPALAGRRSRLGARRCLRLHRASGYSPSRR